MPQVPVTWGEWRPDLATLDTQYANDVENVFPGSNSYLPCPALSPFADTIVPIPPATEPIVGLTSARTKDGTWRVYAGSTKRLYRWTLSGWTDVSRTTGGNYNVPVGEMWSFAQFGTGGTGGLIAVNINDVPQVIDVDSGTNFTALGGSPPRAHNVRTMGDFVVLGGLAPGSTLPGTTVPTNRQQIIWSGVNDPTSWVSGINLCDYQEMPDGGPVMGLAGDKIGYVIQDRAIRVMQFLPGDTQFIWSISKAVYDRGSVSEFGYCSVNDSLFFLAEDGYWSLTAAQLVPIGHEKINEWFLANSDIARRNIVQCFPAVKPYICWPYHRSPGTSVYDGVMIYNMINQRWARAVIPAQVWGQSALSSIDLDLDTDGTEPGDPLLDSTARGLDSFAYQGGRPLVAAVDPGGFLSTLAGPNLQATLESGEAHLAPGNRAMVGDVYPLSDGADGVIYDGTRERLQDDVVWSQAFPIEITGSAAVYISSRLHRIRHIIPRGSQWTHAQGALVDAQQDGTVA